MDLITERCHIRNFSMEDVDDLYEVLSDKDVMIHIESAFDRERTKFHQYEESDYEIGWILNREYWGKGIADELTKELINYARYIGISSCIIECDTKQNASKKIALKNGFAYEGAIDNLERYRLSL